METKMLDSYFVKIDKENCRFQNEIENEEFINKKLSNKKITCLSLD